jgi:outer membrane protein
MDRFKKTAPLVIVFVLALMGAAYAQQVTKIAVVNPQRAFEQCSEGKKAIAQFQANETKVKADIQKMDDALRLLENRMNTGRLTMTSDALIGLQADIDKKTTERKRYEEDAARDAQQLSANLIQKIRVEMVAVIEALAKEKGFDLVLDGASGAVLTAGPTIDITDEVIRRYDASKATTPAPAPAIKK